MSREILFLRDIVSRVIVRLENLLAHMTEDSYEEEELLEVIDTLTYGLDEQSLELSASDHLFLEFLTWNREMEGIN